MNKSIINLINQCLMLTLLVIPGPPLLPVGDMDFKIPVHSINFIASMSPIFSMGGYSKPTIITIDAQNITETSASLRGQITNRGGSSDLEAWFDYGKTASYGKSTLKKYNIRRKGIISTTVSGLSACTVYHFRGVSKNDWGISYGADKTFKTKCPSFITRISVKNLSRGDTVWYKVLRADPSDQLLFKIDVGAAGDTDLENVKVKLNLASNIIYRGDLKIDDEASDKNITTEAIELGDIIQGRAKKLTFKAKVASKDKFSSNSELISTVLAYNNQISDSANCRIIVDTGTNTGINTDGSSGDTTNNSQTASQISTGISGGILNSILFPLSIAFLLVWIFRGKLVGLDKWMELRKEQTAKYRAEKELKKKIKQIKKDIL